MPVVEKPIAYSLYFKTPSSTRAVPTRNIKNDAHPNMVFLFIFIGYALISNIGYFNNASFRVSYPVFVF